MQCVKCNGTLETVTVEGIELDRCDKCSGIWFDLGELEKILEAGNIDALKNEVDNNKGHNEMKGRCPRCGGRGNMIRVASLKTEGVHIDTCALCYGQWLDGGELEAFTKEKFIDRLRSLFR